MQASLTQVLDALNTVILGKEHQLRLILSCLMAKGHLLLEDLPGMGKTTLSQALAKILGLGFSRIQFTSDLLPADVLGISIFDKDSSQFDFRPGPIFSQVVLADEINRATPKAQSALLEAMEEGQVTVDGQTHLLPKPFFVIATQNPHTQMGTFPLPEAQLDRFLMRVSLGYPSQEAEREIILGLDRRSVIHQLTASLNLEEIFKIQLAIRQVHLAPALLDYVQRLVHFTRTDSAFSYGLSPRGTLGLVHCAQAWAFLWERDHVTPEDVQAVLPAVVGHRVTGLGEGTEMEAGRLTQKLMTDVEVVGHE